MAIKQQQVFNIFTLHGSATNDLKPNRFLKLTATGTEYADEGDIAVGVGMYFPNSSAEYESGELVSAVTGLIFVEAAEAILRGAKIAVGVDGRAKNAGSGDVTVGFSDSAATAASQKILFIPAFGAGVPTESAGEWGSITGDISDQEDLQLELDNKETNRSIEVITSTIDYAITTAVDNRTYEIDTEGNSIILTIPDSTDDAVHFKILLADSVGGGDITVVTATGQLIGGQTSQAVQLNQKGFEVTEITDAYSITQDSRAAIPSSSLEFFATNTTDPVLTTYLQSVTNTDDSRYTTVTTKQSAAITTTNQITGQFITDAGAVIGVLNEGSISLVAELRKNLAVQKDISIYMKLFKRDSGGTETELAQSDTMVVSNDTTYSAYTFSMLLPATTVANTDRFVVKSYSTAVGAGQDPILETELMGTNPTRLILPITQSSIAHNSIPGRSVSDAHPQSAITNLVADLALKADLVDGKIPESQLPSIAISDYLGNFTDLATALADSGVQGSQVGDWFTVNTSGGLTYIVITSSPSSASDVSQVLTPTDAVLSVNSQTGNVSITPESLNLEIGTDVQGYSSILANTTASFQTADETKLDYISVTGAVNLDNMATETYVDDAIEDAKGATSYTTKTASFTLALTDFATGIDMSSSSALTITVPPNTSVAFAVGTEIPVARLGSGTVTFVAGSGVTINSNSSYLSIANQYGVAVLRKTATNTWLLFGDLG